MFSLTLVAFWKTSQKFFSPHLFEAVSLNLCDKVAIVGVDLSPHQQLKYLPKSLDKNSIEFEFQTNFICYIALRQSYLAPKINLLGGRYYDNSKTKTLKKHKNEAPASAETSLEVDNEAENTSPENVFHSGEQHSAFSFFAC